MWNGVHGLLVTEKYVNNQDVILLLFSELLQQEVVQEQPAEEDQVCDQAGADQAGWGRPCEILQVFSYLETF